MFFEWRGEGWVRRWVEKNRPELMSELDPFLSQELKQSVEHACVTVGSTDRFRRNRRILQEVDAILTELVAVFMMQKKVNLHAVARMVHS